MHKKIIIDQKWEERLKAFSQKLPKTLEVVSLWELYGESNSENGGENDIFLVHTVWGITVNGKNFQQTLKEGSYDPKKDIGYILIQGERGFYAETKDFISLRAFLIDQKEI